MSQYLEVSSRIQSYLDGSMKSGGASCNTFIVEDNIPGIFDAATWAGQISQSQGAPTLILSKLRPAGAAISTGGTASGPCSFARLFDSIASVMLRPGKKNGVTVLFLDADHPDIDQWISYTFKSTLDRAYTGVLFRPGKKYSARYSSWVSWFSSSSMCLLRITATASSSSVPQNWAVHHPTGISSPRSPTARTNDGWNVPTAGDTDFRGSQLENWRRASMASNFSNRIMVLPTWCNK